VIILTRINPLNAELNAICYLLALLEAHPILHISRIRVKLHTILYAYTSLLDKYREQKMCNYKCTKF